MQVSSSSASGLQAKWGLLCTAKPAALPPCDTGLATWLKRHIKQPRPPLKCELLGNCEQFGMPSNHTQVRPELADELKLPQNMQHALPHETTVCRSSCLL